MTEAERQKWRNNWIDEKVKDMTFEKSKKFINGNYELDLMQSFADEQVKKALMRFLSWRDKRYGTPNPNPQLYDLDVYNFLNEKS